jgi:ribosomal protein S18 acetylase RimI-like enzyme
MNNEIKIIDYHKGLQPWFESLNRAWIEKYFYIEPQDNWVLAHPEDAFIRSGGAVLMASFNDTIVGTVALKKMDGRTYELAKMGVDEKYHGNGLGSALINAAVRKAKLLDAEKLVLYSNTKLQPAIHLYRKFGFREVILEEGRLARCNIKMELILEPVTVMNALAEEASIIAAIGRESFRYAFVDFFNRKEDLDLYIGKTYHPEKIAASILKANNIFFIAYYQGEAAGFVKIKKQSLNKHISSQHQAELQKIYVLKKYHGLGVADALLKKVMTVTKESDADHLWLDVIIENTRAIHFYQKNGFTRCGNHSFVIGSQTFHYDVMSLPVVRLFQNQHTASEMV